MAIGADGGSRCGSPCVRSAPEVTVGMLRNDLVPWFSGVAAVLLLMFGLARPVSATLTVESLPANRTITVDGATTEWRGLALAYLGKSVHILGVARDRSNLYLMWRFSDRRLARRVMARGVTIWLNGDGKKKESFGVRYAGSEGLARSLKKEMAATRRRAGNASDREDREPARGMPPGDVPRDQRRPDGMRRRGPSRLQQPGTLTIFEGDKMRVVYEDNEHGPRAASALRDGVYGYEMLIPLKMIGGKVARMAAGEPGTLRIGIEIGGMSSSERKVMRERAGDRGEQVRVRGGAGDGGEVGEGMEPGRGIGGMGEMGEMGEGMGREGGVGGVMGGGMPGRMGRGMKPGRMGAGRRGMRRMSRTGPEWLKVELAAAPKR